MQLYEQAMWASDNAYAPYSKFKVGAALLAASGEVYSGVNVENSSYGATICAERTAFVKALSEGERKFIAIAVYAQETEAIPCGICRQFMYEFAPDIKVITGVSDADLNIRSLDELLPIGFRLEGEK
ncbi:MAG: cytidine deaminase [Eubacterium sp.]|nr:cytidine deaminase [Candidatus Colimonas fimequi]